MFEYEFLQRTNFFFCSAGFYFCFFFSLHCSKGLHLGLSNIIFLFVLCLFLHSLSMVLSPKNRTNAFKNIVFFFVVVCVDHMIHAQLVAWNIKHLGLSRVHLQPHYLNSKANWIGPYNIHIAVASRSSSGEHCRRGSVFFFLERCLWSFVGCVFYKKLVRVTTEYEVGNRIVTEWSTGE